LLCKIESSIRAPKSKSNAIWIAVETLVHESVRVAAAAAVVVVVVVAIFVDDVVVADIVVVADAVVMLGQSAFRFS
jgi:hypothetical protein